MLGLVTQQFTEFAHQFLHERTAGGRCTLRYFGIQPPALGNHFTVGSARFTWPDDAALTEGSPPNSAPLRWTVRTVKAVSERRSCWTPCSTDDLCLSPNDASEQFAATSIDPFYSDFYRREQNGIDGRDSPTGQAPCRESVNAIVRRLKNGRGPLHAR